jgi:hypothetical protein
MLIVFVNDWSCFALYATFWQKGDQLLSGKDTIDIQHLSVIDLN